MKKTMVAYFILKVLTAFSLPLFLIITYDLTSSAIYVGIVSFLLAFGDIVGNVYWYKMSRRKNVFLLSYLSFISLFLLLFNKISLVLISAYLFSFFNAAGYISLLHSKFFRKKPKERLAKFEKFGGIAYVIGLALGFSIKLISYFEIIPLIEIFALISILSLYKTIRREVEKEVSKGLIAIEDFIEKSPKGFSLLISTIVRSLTLFSFTFFSLRKPSKIKFHIPYILFFFAAGLLLPQIVTVIKEKNLGDIWVYFSYFLGSLFSLLGYQIIQKTRNSKKIGVSSLFLRVFLFLSFFFLTILSGIFLQISIIVFKILQGFTWGVLLVWFNYLIIKRKKSELGINLSLRSFSSSLGNFFGGFLFEFNPLILSLVSSSLIVGSIVLLAKNLR